MQNSISFPNTGTSSNASDILQNKTLIDDTTYVADATDVVNKKFKWESGAITVPRTITVPDVDFEYVYITSQRNISTTWTIPGGTNTIVTHLKRIGNPSQGFTVFCAIKIHTGAVAATAIITSPATAVPSGYRPNSIDGYISRIERGRSAGAYQTFHVQINNSGVIQISTAAGGIIDGTGGWQIGPWVMTWDTSMPDL